MIWLNAICIWPWKPLSILPIIAIASANLPTPESNQDSFTRLEAAGQISSNLAARLRAWAGFRNILVDEYLTIDHAIAWKVIHAELGDLEEFIQWAVSKLS